MIVEFVGVSGVGKSTYANKYFNEKKNDGIDIEWPRYELYEQNNWFFRNFKKSFSIFIFTLFHIQWVINFYKLLGRFEVSKFKDKIVVFFNGIHLKYMQLKCKNSNCEYIFDEGAFQLILAVFLRTSQKYSYEILDDFFLLFDVPKKLIIVDAQSEIIKKRLENRDRKTKILEFANLIDKIEEIKSFLNYIIDYSKKKFNTNNFSIDLYDNNIDEQ